MIKTPSAINRGTRNLDVLSPKYCMRRKRVVIEGLSGVERAGVDGRGGNKK